MSSETIRQLRDLTMELTRKPFKLAALPGFVGNVVKRYGKTTVTSILSLPTIGVVDVVMPAGEIFPMHNHDMLETVHLADGKLTIAMDDGTHRALRAPQSTTIDPREAHTVLAITDSRFVCVTMPRDPGYPR